MRPVAHASLSLTLLVSACGEQGEDGEQCSPGELVPLTESPSWTLVAAEDDPLADHRPADDSCPDEARILEAGALEVDTELCKYLMVEQPAKQAIRPCAKLELTLLHFELVAPEPAQAHAALLVGDEVVWEHSVSIPAEVDTIVAEIDPQIEAPAGTPIRFHLHNHGYNTWALLGVEVENTDE